MRSASTVSLMVGLGCAPGADLMSPIIDAGVMICQRVGHIIPWHVEDKCWSDASNAIKPVG